MKFINVIDEKLKDDLLAMGYKLLKQESIQNKTVWTFEYIKPSNFSHLDKKKYFISDTMYF